MPTWCGKRPSAASARHLVKGERYILNDDCYPHYIGEFIRQDVSTSYWEVGPRPNLKTVDLAYLITHFNPLYGHWLLEIFPKLFAVKALLKRGLIAPILVPTHIPSFVLEAIAEVVPEAEVIEYNRVTETVRVKRAVLPGMMHRDYVFNAAFLDALNTFLEPVRQAPGPSAIFVSRSGLTTAFRRLENADAVDAAAERLGLTVIRPEELPWREQVRLFASARLIVGEYGSGMHNAIFAPVGTKVVCLNAVNELQGRIANACGHALGYLLDPDGRPRLFEGGWQTQQSYRIDLDAFEARIGPLMGQ